MNVRRNLVRVLASAAAAFVITTSGIQVGSWLDSPAPAPKGHTKVDACVSGQPVGDADTCMGTDRMGRVYVTDGSHTLVLRTSVTG